MNKLPVRPLLKDDILYFNTVDSTNDVVKKMAVKKAKPGTAVVAYTQSKGRGREGRNWYSPPGEGLYFSMLVKPQEKPKDLIVYVRRTAEIVANVLQCTYNVPVQIEWPNDLILQGKKAGGILLEAVTRGGKTSFLILGIGLNLNQERFPQVLKHSAISLRQATGLYYDLEEVARNIREALYHEFCQRIKRGDHGQTEQSGGRARSHQRTARKDPKRERSAH